MCLEQEGVYSANVKRNQRLSSTASIWVIYKEQASKKDDFIVAVPVLFRLYYDSV